MGVLYIIFVVVGVRNVKLNQFTYRENYKMLMTTFEQINEVKSEPYLLLLLPCCSVTMIAANISRIGIL